MAWHAEADVRARRKWAIQDSGEAGDPTQKERAGLIVRPFRLEQKLGLENQLQAELEVASTA